jgi:hypothetical protein
MVTRIVVAASTFLILTLGLSVARSDLRAAGGTQDPSAPHEQHQLPSSPPGAMNMHEHLMAEMRAADAKLDAMIKEMNAAKGEAKILAMSAVIGELVRQQKAMHEGMAQMHLQMIGGRGMMMRK